MKHPTLEVGSVVNYLDCDGVVYWAEVISFTQDEHWHKKGFVDLPDLQLEDGRIVKEVGQGKPPHPALGQRGVPRTWFQLKEQA